MMDSGCRAARPMVTGICKSFSSPHSGRPRARCSTSATPTLGRCDGQRAFHAGVEGAAEWYRPRAGQYDRGALSRRKIDIEAVVGRSRRMAEQIPIYPDDSVADAETLRRRTERHLV